MRKADLAIGLSFLALGLYVALEALRLPGGVGRLPGPGFFPLIVGVLMVALALVAVGRALRGDAGGAFRLQNRRELALALLLTAAYVALWGVGTFPLRTALYLVAVLRVLGERWPRAAAVAVVLTAIVTLSFSFGLRVSLE